MTAGSHGRPTEAARIIGAAFSGGHHPTLVIDGDGAVAAANAAAETVFGLGDDRLVGEPWRGLLRGLDALIVDGPPVEVVTAGGALVARSLRATARSIHGVDDVTAVVELVDVTDRRDRAPATPPTGRDAFVGALADRSSLLARPRWVVVIDIDRLRLINDVAGPASGDAAVRVVAEACGGSVGAEDLIGRLGGGAFAVALAERSRGQVEQLAAGIAGRVHRSEVAADGLHPVRPSVSFGIARLDLPSGADHAAASAAVLDALAAADRDLRHRKPVRAADRPPVVAGDMTIVWAERFTHEMSTGRFALWKQPIACARTLEVVGHEILIRATDPAGSPVPAGEFVPVAERLGLIPLLDQWVLESAARYRDLVSDGRRVSVNLSALTLGRPDGTDAVIEWLARGDLAAHHLTLEVTETAPLEPALLLARCIELTEAGFEVSIDDFGTGFAAHERLVDLPCAEVKVAGSLVSRLQASSGVRATVEGMIRSAHAAGVRTVAEGVEDRGLLELVTDLGVDRVQGYHVGHPTPIEPPPGPLAAPLA